MRRVVPVIHRPWNGKLLLHFAHFNAGTGGVCIERIEKPVSAEAKSSVPQHSLVEIVMGPFDRVYAKHVTGGHVVFVEAAAFLVFPAAAAWAGIIASRMHSLPQFPVFRCSMYAWYAGQTTQLPIPL